MNNDNFIGALIIGFLILCIFTYIQFDTNIEFDKRIAKLDSLVNKEVITLKDSIKLLKKDFDNGK